MHIKKVYKNEALPTADGYLVQYKFKNGFKDFRIGDCMFAKDLSSLNDLVKTADDLNHRAFAFNGEGAEAAIKFLRDNGYDVVEDTSGYMTAYLARGVKVWALTDGKTLPAATSVYITRDHQHLTPAEYSRLEKETWAEVRKLLPKTMINRT